MAAAAGERYQAFIEQTGDLRVCDVMTPMSTLAPGWWTVADFVGRLAPEQLREPAFPVVGFDGQPEGVLTAGDLDRVPAQQRATRRVLDACHPHPLTITPDKFSGGSFMSVRRSRLSAAIPLISLPGSRDEWSALSRVG
jgi:hypothetical protein